MRNLLLISAAALLAGSMAAYAADVQGSEAATSATVGGPSYIPAARAQVPTEPAPAVEYRIPADGQDPNLSR